MNLIDAHRAYYDTLVLGYLKEQYNLQPADASALTDCEPVREAHRHAVAELRKANETTAHLLALAQAVAAGGHSEN